MFVEETDINPVPFHILIVDDEPDIHAAITMCIKNEMVFGRPIKIHTANSKAQARKFVDEFEHEISLIFLDVIMETENAGFEFLSELREIPFKVQPQVALVTGQAGLASERDASRKHEINAYLSKADLNPYRLISILHTSIRNFLTIKKLEATTEELNDSQQLHEDTNSYVRGILNALSDALIVVNQQGTIVSANPSVTKIFGYEHAEVIGQPIEILMPEPFASKHKQYMAAYEQTGEAQIIGKGRELPAIKKNGSTFPMELTLTEFTSKGEKLYIGLVRNISDRIEAQREIYQLAFFDSVTNLPNLDNFYKQLEQQVNIKSLNNELMSLALVDLSGFYRINQAYGHDVGDQLLTLLVDRIEWVIPKSAKLFRSDGTDFIIQLNSTLTTEEERKEELGRMATTIIETIEQDVVLGTSHHQISANIGILIRSAKLIEPSKILHQLEFATSRAKLINDKQFEFYESKLELAETERFILEQELSKAIERDEFVLNLQPQYNKNKNIVSSEALIRWHSNNLGMVSPFEFIAIAEQSGQIVQIGRWVLEKVCLYLADSQAKGINTNIAINVSAKELLQPDFVQVVTACLNKYQVTAQNLTFEITESVFATDIETVIQNMESLSSQGIRFSIDDFGTGYSSLSYLKRLPIQELKIDKSFIDDIETSVTPVPLVDAIITMADALGLDLVAEGVEHEHQFSYLMNHGNILNQGYLFSKPLPYREWLTLIANHSL